jgi:dihydroorotate dehydrogenase (fumarate)
VIYNEGFDYVAKMIDNVTQWMEEKEYDSVEQLKGSMSQENCPNPEAFARGNYMKALVGYASKPI